MQQVSPTPSQALYTRISRPFLEMERERASSSLVGKEKRESIAFYLVLSVRVRPNLRSTVPGTKRPRHFLRLYRRFRHVAGRLPIPGRGQEVEDHGLRPWKHRAGGTRRISDWLRSLRPRGENGPLPPRLLLHRPRHMYELSPLFSLSIFSILSKYIFFFLLYTLFKIVDANFPLAGLQIFTLNVETSTAEVTLLDEDTVSPNK